MSDLITPQSADAIVETLFKWIYDRNFPPCAYELNLSTIAAIVCDATHADITVQPLHNAYARAKAKRGLK